MLRKAPGVLLFMALVVLCAPLSHAAAVSALSVADTLDSRPPNIEILYPAGTELFNYTESETLLFTIAEQSWGPAPGPIGYKIISEGSVLDQGTLEPEPTGTYALIWTVPGFAAAGPAQTANLIVSAVDRFGWAAVDTSAQFEILDEVTDVPGNVFRDGLNMAVPNPFNPSTSLSFDLVAPAVVKLAVYDLRGREVAALVSERRTAGHHQVIWAGRGHDGHALASGLYFARLAIRGPDRDLSFVTRLTLVK